MMKIRTDDGWLGFTIIVVWLMLALLIAAAGGIIFWWGVAWIIHILPWPGHI